MSKADNTTTRVFCERGRTQNGVFGYDYSWIDTRKVTTINQECIVARYCSDNYCEMALLQSILK